MFGDLLTLYTLGGTDGGKKGEGEGEGRGGVTMRLTRPELAEVGDP